MNLRIVNLRTYTPVPGEVLIKVDRSSPVGNKFHMKNESMRDEVCDKYKTYFRCRIQEDTLFTRYLNNICDVLMASDVALGCWCAPKRCHAETIVMYVLGQVLSATWVK